ncbi:MAG: hypothetical protein R6X33_10650, partial [Candidatus Brocadiia bacterium]
LGRKFFDVEHRRSGVYDEEKAGRIDRALELAGELGIRVKMCIENFRHFGSRPKERTAKVLHLVEHGGPARDIADFFDGEASREQFKGKLAWYADRYGSQPAVFGWELWNEINTVAGGRIMEWTEVMLEELHRLFPDNLCMQSLGSFDTQADRELYRRLSTMPGNDVAQVHRYLDLGADLAVCHGPVDVLTADAVRELQAFEPGRPIILAESGAVEPSHTGPFKYYEDDTEGIILHDVLFAPFFAGAAGPGHCWHWGHYVDRNDLWWHFGRFAEAVKGVDPAGEGFEPVMLSHPRLRVYALKGKDTTLLWCRDTAATWMSELRDGQPAEPVTDAVIEAGEDLTVPASATVRTYDPWSDEWTDASLADGAIELPPFRRSLVVRIG